MSRKLSKSWEKDHKWLTYKHGYGYCKICLYKVNNTYKKYDLAIYENSKNYKNENFMKLSANFFEQNSNMT